MNLTDLFFTRRCACCGELLDITEPDRLCAECASDIRVIADKLFYVENIDCCKAYCLYTGAARKGLIRFKYGSDRNSGAYFADMTAQMLKNERLISSNAAIVCIPGNKSETKREYVQAELLAKRIAKQLRLEYIKGALLKKKNVRSQTSCRTREERLRNVRRAFRVNPAKKKALMGRELIIIDDIYTTGATLRAAAGVLKRSGVAKIYGACAARTPAPLINQNRFGIKFNF